MTEASPQFIAHQKLMNRFGSEPYTGDIPSFFKQVDSFCEEEELTALSQAPFPVEGGWLVKIYPAANDDFMFALLNTEQNVAVGALASDEKCPDWLKDMAVEMQIKKNAGRNISD